MNDQNPHKLPKTGATVATGDGFCADASTGAVLKDALGALLWAEGAYIKKVSKRNVIANEGFTQEGLIAVLDGLVKLSTSLRDGRTQILGLRFPGEFITLRMPVERWFASVEAVEDTTLLILASARADKLRLENPQFNMDLNMHVNREIAITQGHLVTLGRRSPIERLASLLIEFNDRGMGSGDASGEVRIPISRDEIGDYIGLESETVSRQFTRLKSDGFISLISPSRVVVRDWAALVQLSNGESSVAAE